MIKICFVCTGNTCRSVMAERLFLKELKNRKLLNIKVNSAGVRANGDNITENAKYVLKQLGANSKNRASKGLSKINNKTLYVTMENAHKQYVKAERVKTFGELVGGNDVPEPYGQSKEVYMQTAEVLLDYCRKLAERLEKQLTLNT